MGAMRQQRVKMEHFDREVLLQHHQQAITHALAPQQSNRSMPAQLVFPDDTMAIASPAVARGQLFLVDSNGAPETEEERQRRLLASESVVVYTSLSDQEVRTPEIAKRWLALLFVMGLQAICIIMALTGSGSGSDVQAPSPMQVTVYVAQMVLHLLFLLAMYLGSADMLNVYTVLVTLLCVLIVAIAVNSVLDVVICSLSLPVVLLASAIRDLMMPHCFTVRSD